MGTVAYVCYPKTGGYVAGYTEKMVAEKMFRTSDRSAIHYVIFHQFANPRNDIRVHFFAVERHVRILRSPGA